MRLPIKPMIVMIVDVIMMTSLSVKFLYYISWLTSFSPKGMPHITKVMCCFIIYGIYCLRAAYYGDGSLWRTIPLSEVGVVPSRQSRFATALDRSLSGKHSHYPAFYFSILVH